ncbi:protein mono-ADP-ribosyltransferase PARP14 [Biomphalaria glabrata]|nr:protein mono-ADP-ribosyltransferase PARP14 [Biomphalaria glabrata]
MKQAKKEDNYLPNYWRKNFYKFLVPVDDLTKTAITKVVHDTWREDLVGKGLDANDLALLGHRRLEVIDVHRVENPVVFGRYQKAKNDLLDKTIALNEPSRRIVSIHDSSNGDPNTTSLLADFLKRDLCPEINECYVLHGTKTDRIGALSENGLRTKNANPNAMFGKGIYTTDSSTKADQYADFRHKRRPLHYRNKLVLSRILLGNVFLYKDMPEKDECKLSGPPCMRCLQDVCNCNFTKFDSVLGEHKLRFREFVTYDEDKIYPEYIITYKRRK